MNKTLIEELKKLKEGEIYLEIGIGNGQHLSDVRKELEDGIVVCGIGLSPDPKIKNTLYIGGKSQDIAESWMQVSGMSLVSLLYINDDPLGYKNIKVWESYLKPGGVIILNKVKILLNE